MADPSLGGTRMAANQDGPKSAENVNEQAVGSMDRKGRVPSSKIVGTIKFCRNRKDENFRLWAIGSVRGTLNRNKDYLV